VVVAALVRDPERLSGRAPRREAWYLASAAALDGSLRRAGGRLVVRRGDAREEIPRLARDAGASLVAWNREYGPRARRRDAAVERACREAGIEVRTFADGVLAEPGAVLTATGRPYTVFTPYHRTWSAVTAAMAPRERPRARLAAGPEGLELTATGAPDAGEAAAARVLAAFVRGPLARYAAERDRLDVASTSRLSPHLRVGAVSPRRIVTEVRRAAARGEAARSAEAFVRELAWRDFFVQVLWHAPATRTEPLRRDRAGLRWRDDPAALAAWREGRTGYPLVDAGMRQLAAEGWMPNRARLVAASFLVKHLLVDWREGDRWFMRELLDGDPAVNGGNWQWVASVGADALPAFRIFNPVTQGERFDPAGRYVRRWVPELATVADARVHAPWVAGGAAGYPPPIVDHREARRRALAVLTGSGRA
jgi:deoxyribodipyrimidine photo-lyase